MKYLVCDTETGGLNANFSLLSAHFAIYDTDFNLLEDLSLTLKPSEGPFNIDPKALEINKINLVQHNKEAITYEEGAAKLADFLNRNATVFYPTSLSSSICEIDPALVNNYKINKLTLIGHNIGFDIDFIAKYLLTQMAWEGYISHRKVDTAAVARFLQMAGRLPSDLNCSLTNIAKYFNINVDGAHEARFDVELTVQVLKRMLHLVKI